MSPETPPLETVACDVNRQLPPVDASQKEMWVSVSVAFRVSSTYVDRAMMPDAAAAQVVAYRVVCAEALDVPLAPGSPV